MLRSLVPALAFIGLVVASCGGGAKPADPAAGASPPAPSASPGADSRANQQPTPDRPLATPTPASNDAVAVAIAAGDRHFNPTVAEFRSLPTTEIAAEGAQRGVLLADLASRIGASAASVVTIQGYRNDMATLAFVRKPLAEIASTTVFVIDASGHVNIASTNLPRIEWLRAVSMIGFQQ